MLVLPRRGSSHGSHGPHGSPGRFRRLGGALATRLISPGRLRWTVAAVMAFTLLGGDRGLIRLIGLLRDRAALQAEITRLTARSTQLERDARNYASDEATIEKVAREELDLIRRGETVYKFPK